MCMLLYSWWIVERDKCLLDRSGLQFLYICVLVVLLTVIDQ